VNGFDKLCAIAAFLLGIVMLVLGGIGLFAGCSAHFTLPPVAGVIPAFVGWGIVRPIWLAWSRPQGSHHYQEREPQPEMRELDYWDDEQGRFRQSGG
jgi:hypothetical protein